MNTVGRFNTKTRILTAVAYLVSAFGLLFYCAVSASAQVPTGSIVGTVKDAQGLPVADAAVTLTNQGTNYQYTSSTSSTGAYQFQSIDFGTYRISVTKDGFKAGVVQDIKLDASTQHSLPPITLEVGAKAETVVVEGGAQLVNTTSAELTSTVENKQIEDLPVLNRSAIALLGLEAGVSNSGPNGLETTTINGQRTSFSNVTLDGINIQDNFIRDNALDFTPNLPFNSQAQEFTVITQNADVENGGGASQVSIVTPKGTNDWHGNGFWYYRTNAWAANNWFNDASGISKPGLLQNQGGGNLGGPVIKNKLFIYGYYEFLRLRAQTPNNTTILSPTIQAALTSGTPTLPFTYQPVDNTGNPSGAPQTVNLFTLLNTSRGGNPVYDAMGNYVSGAPVFTPDAAVTALLARMPKTSNNTRNGDGVNLLGYQLNARNNQTQDNYGFRGDYDLNAHNTFSATYSWNRQIVDRPDIDTSYNTVPLVTNNDAIKFLSTAWRWNPRSDFTNEVRFGFDLAPAFFVTAQKFGSYILNDNSLAFTDPDPNFLPQGRNTHTWSWQDNASWVKGNHVVKFGAQVQRVTIFSTGSGGIYPALSLAFSGQSPYAPGTSDFPVTVAGTQISSTDLGNASAILANVAGLLGSVTQTLNATSQTSGYVAGAAENRNYSQNDWSFYLGDTWRINRKLTLTYGTRYEYFSPVDEKNGLVLLPNVTAGQTVSQTLLGNAAIGFAGGPSKRGLYNRDMNNFAPVVGIAWDPFGDGRTAIRAGFSMNYVNDSFFTAASNAAAGNTGLQTTSGIPNIQGSSTNIYGPTLTNPAGNLTVPVPPFQIQDFLTNAHNFTDAGAGIGSLAGYAVDPNIKTPYVQQWNLSVQRNIGWGTSLTVSYVGNHGVGLFRAIDVNQLQFNQNGFLADFNNARNNIFQALQANPHGGLQPGFNPAVTGSQPTPVFDLLALCGLIGGQGCPGGVGKANQGIANLIYQGQIGALETYYHANEYDTGNNPYPGFNNPVALFPNPYIMGGDLLKNSSFSNYNAGVVEVRRRFGQGLYFQANYAFSKVMTDFEGSQSQFSPYQDNARPRLERGRAGFDLTHAFKANFTYELPIGKGHRLLSTENRALGLLVNGWKTASIFTWQSGAPFSILSQWPSFNRGLRTANNTAFATLTHQQISSMLGTFKQPNGTVYIINPSLISPNGTGVPGKPQLSCTPAVTGGFCNPQPGEVGNLQLNAFNGPAYFDWDFSAGKDFNLSERFKLSFRTEAFNVLNHPVFSTISFSGVTNTNVNAELINSTTFGQSTSTVSQPRILQMSLHLSF